MNSKELHEKILYPVCRVRAEKAGGSGVLVYSEPDPLREGKYINIALTCEHVIEGAITVKEEWNSVLKKDVKAEVFDQVQVEMFDYEESELISANATKAEIIAYDKHHDIAAVRLYDSRKMPFVASVIPKDEIKDLRRFDEVWVSGCSLGHDPFASRGQLTYLREPIDQKDYLMSNAPSVFGNSGGGLFHGKGYLLGLTSRISTIQLGFGIDVMTWMGFSTHPDRLYEFFEKQELQFIYDQRDNYADAMKRREKKRKQGLLMIAKEMSGEGKTDESDD